MQCFDGIVANAAPPTPCCTASPTVSQTLSQDAPTHRLRHDLRRQSLFEESFRADVAEIDGSPERMIWRAIEAYAGLPDTTPTCTPSFAYATVDGLAQQALPRHLAGVPDALVLRDAVRRQLATLFGA